MTRTASTSVENNFTKGLITEATGMNFPENAAQDALDVDFHPVGAVTRRAGMDVEVSGVFQTVTNDTAAVNEYLWKNVANLGNLSFVVQQVGQILYFFEVSGFALSPGLKSDTVDLADFRIPGAPTVSDGSVCEFAAGNGKLFVTYPYCQPFYITYDFGSDTLTGTEITILARDFRRLEDGSSSAISNPTIPGGDEDFNIVEPSINSHLTTLTDAHKYNLLNQGWYYSTDVQHDPNNTNADHRDNVLTYYHAQTGTWPSNSDIWWLGKNASDLFVPSLVQRTFLGNTPAPNGHYIMDPFNTSRSSQSGISGLPEDTAGSARPSCVAFYSGRVWYAGTAANGYGDHVYFSQILENDSQVGNCFQQQDPTSEQDSDLLPSDGGVVVIQGLGTCVKMLVIGSLLLVFASNGVWSVSGGSGQSFLASDYAVQKISDQNAVGHMSFVTVEGAVLWWNYYGIYLLTPDQTGAATVASATDQTIKTFYQEIPQDNIPFVKGAYNPAEKQVQWIYRNETAPTVEASFQYDRIMNLRTNTQAFFPWTVGTAADVAGAPFVSGIVAVSGSGIARTDDTVTANGVQVIL